MSEAVKSYNRIIDGPMSNSEQALVYYRVLNQKGLGKSFFCHRGDTFGQYCTRKEEAFEKQYELYADSTNCYITLNSFSGEYRLSDDKTKRGWFRAEKDVRYINGLLIDFDVMKNKGKNPAIEYSIEEGDKLVDQIIGDMEELVFEDKMVYPTLLTKSGRGLQYIILYSEPIPKSDEEAMFKHKKLYKTVTTYLQSLYDKNLVEVDTAVTDAPRICRLPGTKHVKNERYAELQQYNATCYYDLDELCDLFEVDMSPEEKKKPGRPKKEKKEKKKDQEIKYYPLGPRELPKLTTIQKKDIKSRLKVMKKLAQVRGMVSGDMREVMCFWYYCHLRQIMVPIAAMQETNWLNKSFDEPLSKAELLRCIYGAQTHVGEGDYPDGYYVCSRETLAAQLCMSEEEIEETGLFKRREERERAAANRKVKEKHKQFLFAMLTDGALERAEIVKLTMEHTGRSQATVYRWISEFEKTFSNSLIIRKNKKNDEKSRGESEAATLPSGIEYVELTREELIDYYKNFGLVKKSEREEVVIEDGQCYVDKYYEKLWINGTCGVANITKTETVVRYKGETKVSTHISPREKLVDIRPLQLLIYNKQGKIDTHCYPDEYLKGHWDCEKEFRNGKYRNRWVFNKFEDKQEDGKYPVPANKSFLQYKQEGDEYRVYYETKEVFNEELVNGIERIYHQEIVREGVVISKKVTSKKEYQNGYTEDRLIEEWILGSAI
ncbi:MAG: hypothetical protein IKJ39_00080 [Lachnospiraceae bacterium]|nr:hypothetical protein [Lachnospiraceae bacterium]